MAGVIVEPVGGITEVGAMCGVPYWRVRYAIRTGGISRPVKWNGAYLFTRSDVESFREWLNRQATKRPGPEPGFRDRRKEERVVADDLEPAHG